jgi:hypothetical protein
MRRRSAVFLSGKTDIPEKSSPEAARWWRDNVPFMFRPKECLLFAAHVCKVV